MAKAYECDKCGGFFVKQPSKMKYLVSKINCTQIDLCPKCQKQLDIFLGNPETIVIDPRSKSTPCESVEGEG